LFAVPFAQAPPEFLVMPLSPSTIDLAGHAENFLVSIAID
jgi:hypothetical protein